MNSYGVGARQRRADAYRLRDRCPLCPGYVPVDHDDQGSSQTVEYAYDDWTIARMARALGRNDVAAAFEKRALNWTNVFDAKAGFVRPRLASGNYLEPFDPARAGQGSGFAEGNSWQYSWYQPQDEGGLIRRLGGDGKLVARLDAMFNAKVDPKQYADVEDISGMIGQYIHGNEPSHHLSYLTTTPVRRGARRSG